MPLGKGLELLLEPGGGRTALRLPWLGRAGLALALLGYGAPPRRAMAARQRARLAPRR